MDLEKGNKELTDTSSKMLKALYEQYQILEHYQNDFILEMEKYIRSMIVDT